MTTTATHTLDQVADIWIAFDGQPADENHAWAMMESISDSTSEFDADHMAAVEVANSQSQGYEVRSCRIELTLHDGTVLVGKASTLLDTEVLVAGALEDAAAMPEGARIAIDPNVGGLGYWFDSTDSGPIGYDANQYGEGDIDTVKAALVAAGYDVR